jgi:hypothetical protein
MLGISASAQKCADLDIGQVTSRWGIRLMPDKYVPGSGITAEKPPISIRAAVELFSSPGPSASLRFVLPVVTPLGRNPGMPCGTHLPADGPLNGVGFVDKFDGPNPQLLDEIGLDGSL